jgi:2-oxoisovalerate dehydrogenase E2 component (dihydrolipoyl transacylase)
MAASELAAPLTQARVAQAKDMIHSNNARAWGSREIDMTRVCELVDRSAVGLPALPPTLPGTFVIAVQVICRTLAKVPVLNSRWSDEGIRVGQHIDIGLEIATGRGRVVPVVKDADRLSLAELAGALISATQRAAAGPESVVAEQGTFTVGNSGAYGSVLSRPLIHDGQAAIYHFGTIRKVPFAVDDGIAIRAVCFGSMAFDHRVMDGGTSSRFQNLVKSGLETWTPENTAL